MKKSSQTSVPKNVPSTDLDKSDRTKQTLPATVGTTQVKKTLELTAKSGTESIESDQTKATAAVGTTLDTPSVAAREIPAKGTDSASKEIPVETSSVGETTIQVNTPNDLLLSQYPWTKTATICLTKVDPLVIDIWTDAVHEYWCHDVGTTSD